MDNDEMTTTEEKPTYEFGTSPNGYFQDSDGLVTRSDGKSIRIRFDDNCVSVCVKDHGTPWDKLDDDTKRKLNELVAAKGPMMSPNWGAPADYGDVLYERIREQWWHDAEWLVGDGEPGTVDPDAPDWATGVHSTGRSGGWCVIEGTQALAEHFPDSSVEKAISIAVDSEEEKEIRAHYRMRDEFLALAFDLVDNIDAIKDSYLTEMIEEEYLELEEKRAANIILGEN